MTTTTIYRDGIRFELGDGGGYATGYGERDGLPVVRVWDCICSVWRIMGGSVDRYISATLQQEEREAIKAHLGPRPGCRQQ